MCVAYCVFVVCDVTRSGKAHLRIFDIVLQGPIGYFALAV